MLLGDAKTGISHTDVEMAVHRLRRHPYLAHVGELDGISDEVEEDMREALLITDANGKRLDDHGLVGVSMLLHSRPDPFTAARR
jgi:hypothetical protein